MRRLVGTLASASLLAIVGACSLTTDLGGLSGGAPDASTNDGANADARTGDDGSTKSDGGANGDGGVAAPFCDSLPTTAALCDEFDRPSGNGPWDELETSATASVDFVPSTRGMGRELRMRIAGVAGTDASSGGLEKRVDGATKRVTYAFALRVDSFPSGGNAQAMTINLQNGGYNNVFVFVRPGGITIGEQSFPQSGNGGFSAHDLATDIDWKQWHAVEVVVELSPPRIVMRVDGAQQYAGPAFALPPLPLRAAFKAGSHYAQGPIDDLTFRVDDVAAYVE